MPLIITATYEDGVFRPSEPLDLSPHSTVQLTIEPHPVVQPPTAIDLTPEEKRSDLVKHWLQMRPIVSSEPHLTRDELHERR